MASAFSVKIRCAYLCLNALRSGYQRPLSYRHDLTSAGRILNASAFNFSTSGSKFSDDDQEDNSGAKPPQDDTEKTANKTGKGGQKKLNLAKPRSSDERKAKKVQKEEAKAGGVDEMFEALEKETDTMAKALPGNQTENRQELIAKLQQMSIKKVRKHALGSQNKVAQLSTKGLRRSNLEKEEDPDSSDSSDSSDDEDLKEELKEASKIVAKALPPDTGKKRQAQLQRLKKRLMEEAAVQGREMRESREIEPSQSKKEGKISKKIEPTKKFRAAAKEKENKEAETPQSKEETSKRISDLIKSMDVKIHKTVHPKDMMEDSGKRRGGGGGDRRKKFGQPRNAHGRSPMSTKHLYEGPALGVFTKDGAPLDHLVASEPNFFDSLEDEIHMEEIELPPMTAYQEMMQWTKQNKTWRFPIDNEWGMDEEAQVGFHEHVFLSHLITDFPKGPIRHYMELVATGLSKNPHMTVQEKHGHIEWYREYFADKQKLVDELIEADDVA